MHQGQIWAKPISEAHSVCLSGRPLTSFNITVPLEEPAERVGVHNLLANALEILCIVDFDGKLKQGRYRAHVSHHTHRHHRH